MGVIVISVTIFPAESRITVPGGICSSSPGICGFLSTTSSVVGEGMRGVPGLAGRIFTAVSREQVNIIAIAQGSSELTINLVVRREGLEKAVRAIHEECRMSELAS